MLQLELAAIRETKAAVRKSGRLFLFILLLLEREVGFRSGASDRLSPRA